MKDQNSVIKIQALHPTERDRFRDFIDEVEKTHDVIIRIVSGYRSMEEQQGIYDQGRTKPGKIVTWAIPGSSYHNYGLAVDCVPFKSDHSELDWNYNFATWLPLAIKHGITWGGTFPKGKEDPDHFEYKANNWRDLLHKYHMKDFIPGTEYVNI